MLDSATKGDLKALWAIGYDVYFSMANAEASARALGSLELLVVQDMFMNETAREFAHVFLPAATSFEKDGTFMNAERRVSRVRKAVEPRGESRSDQEIICDLARAMGKGKHFEFETAEDVWNEIRQVWPGAYGITYERIEKAGLQWGCPDEDHPGTQMLHAESFAHGPHANLRMINYRPTTETVSEEFPLLLNTGRTLFQFNAGTMTNRTPNVELMPTDFVCVSPADAKALRIENGEDVVVRSRYGECVMPAAVTGQVKEGELFATFHSPQVFLNRVTSRQRDRFVHAPEYKVTAVRLEKIEPAQ
jgi:formate dehydrogenase major subunit